MCRPRHSPPPPTALTLPAWRGASGHGIFTGRVSNIDKATGYFTISYEDGDDEELQRDELQKLLAKSAKLPPAAAAVTPAAAAAPPPAAPPAIVTSLADAKLDTGRPEVPESTIGGQTTCIICFINPKSHAAVPCGHQCACGDCSAQMKECPVCRSPALMWMHVRVA